MAGFLYFIPDREAGLSADGLRAAGLGYALDGAVHQQHLLSGGPNGRGGIVLADAEHCDPARVRYVAEDQEWIESGTNWIGRWKDDKIGPDDLARVKTVPGHYVELADGNPWLCPAARLHAIEAGAVRWRHVLPRGVVRGPDKKWQAGAVVPRYRRLWEIGLAWWDVRMAALPPDAKVGDTITFDFDGSNESAVECLAANYRIGPEEVSLLGIFDSDSARSILDALIDLPTVIALTNELQKKTDAVHPA